MHAKRMRDLRPKLVRREVGQMESPEDVAVMLRLHAQGWGTKRIAEELGCARNTVRRYVAEGRWTPYAAGRRARALDPHDKWLQNAFIQHRGNAEVVRQELERTHGIAVSLRTVERAVKDRRRELRAQAVATVRFETLPGEQLQADFGELLVSIGGEPTRVHVCVLTLGYSRRIYVEAFPNERQENWLKTMEGAFVWFGGVPETVLVDNARALVAKHNIETREVEFNAGFSQFSRHWGFRPRACAPYRARTKGKDERGVGYVKHNALAGRAFASWEELSGWLVKWTREVSDQRIHGTTGERPLERFERDEAAKLKALPQRGSFHAERQLDRKVHNDACVEVDGNWYSVPWNFVGMHLTVMVRARRVSVHHAGQEIANHALLDGHRQRSIFPEHWEGLTRRPQRQSDVEPSATPVAEFHRSLDVYAAAAAEVAA